MALKITSKSKVSPVSYTRKEIMESKFPDLWERANRAVDKLIALQKDLVVVMPKSKKDMPANYIYLLSLYAFAKKVAQIIEAQCRDLAEKENGKYRDETEDAKYALEKTLDAFETMPWDELLQDESGLCRLKELKEQFQNNMWWQVLPSWSFNDIVGTINTSGIQNESLWNNVNECPVPCEPNINGLLVDDDEMIRIY